MTGSAKPERAGYSAVEVKSYNDGIVDVDVTSYLSTVERTSLEQILSSESLTDLDFEQDGILDALTWSLATEISPKLSVGASR